MQIVPHYLWYCMCVCALFLAATSCMAVMSTSLVASLLLYRHHKVIAPSLCLCVCWTIFPLVLSLLKWAPAPLRIHQYSKRLINRIGFGACLLECDSDFLSHTHQSLTNVTRLLILMSDFGTKLLRLSPPQGVSASLLCHDVAWLTEEILFRIKDVGFGGSLAEVVHYSLSLLAPHLIIAAVPSRLVFCLSKEKQRTLISCVQQNCVAYQKSNFPFSETSVSISALSCFSSMSPSF